MGQMYDLQEIEYFAYTAQAIGTLRLASGRQGRRALYFSFHIVKQNVSRYSKGHTTTKRFYDTITDLSLMTPFSSVAVDASTTQYDSILRVPVSSQSIILKPHAGFRLESPVTALHQDGVTDL